MTVEDIYRVLDDYTNVRIKKQIQSVYYGIAKYIPEGIMDLLIYSISIDSFDDTLLIIVN